jgi:hypothetical protein
LSGGDSPLFTKTSPKNSSAGLETDRSTGEGDSPSPVDRFKSCLLSQGDTGNPTAQLVDLLQCAGELLVGHDKLLVAAANSGIAR